MSHLSIEELLAAVDDGSHIDKDYLRAAQLGVLSGLMAGLMHMYPDIRKDIQLMTQYYTDRAVTKKKIREAA